MCSVYCFASCALRILCLCVALCLRCVAYCVVSARCVLCTARLCACVCLLCTARCVLRIFSEQNMKTSSGQYVRNKEKSRILVFRVSFETKKKMSIRVDPSQCQSDVNPTRSDTMSIRC